MTSGVPEAPGPAGGDEAGEPAPDLLPARMLNEFAYCPRLFFLEWVQGEFEDSTDTVEGRAIHRRVDHEVGALPPPPRPEAAGGKESAEGAPETIHARSVLLSSARLGLIARIDLVEGEGPRVTPVDYKKGSAPDLPEGAWEPERVQLCAQGLVLREAGYACEAGVIYYAASRRRVPVAFDEALVARTLELVAAARATAASGRMPPPLSDSPKCPRCSLVGICLPDETHLLAGEHPEHDEPLEVRRLYPARPDAAPLYVQAQGMSVGKDGDRLVVRLKGAVEQSVRLIDVSQVCLYGNVQVSAQAIAELAARGIPIGHFSYGGYFRALTTGMAHKHVELRRRQYAVAEDPARALGLARAFMVGKLKNARTLLRRNHAGQPRSALGELARLSRRARRAMEAEGLLGLEGAAGRTYFAHFAGMLKPREGAGFAFDFEGRNRRPPRDPVNALLSFCYAVLVKDLTVTAHAVGLDPFLGFYHRPRYGRPALALDLAEEFRPLVADSVVLGLVNTGEIRPADFIRRGDAVALTPEGRRRVLAAYERRMDALVTHPLFGYSVSYRRVLELQVRLLARHLLGEIPRYPAFTTR